jgi:16S rRNA (cytosine1402-N4)-methyltransferase
MTTGYHIPVMLPESIEALDIDGKGTYVDVTFGGGGHSKEILKNITDGNLVVFDKDEDAKSNIIKDDRVHFVPHDFRYIKRYLRYINHFPVNGILADLGISSHQIDTDDRGFAHRMDGVLDMRMDILSPLTAASVVNEYEENKLSNVFYLYGELKNSRKISKILCSYRRTKKIETVNQLKQILVGCSPKFEENKFFSKVFQALRIEVNQELEGLKELLQYGTDCLAPGGRFAVITYHSLEDRIVKQFFNSGNLNNELIKDEYGRVLSSIKPKTKKPILPSAEEIDINPRSRSAKLRIGIKQ